MEAPPGLLDLPLECLEGVCLSLRAADLASLASTCGELREYIQQDALWRHQCEGWLAAKQTPSNGLGRLSASQLLAALRLPTYRLLLQALVRLGAWPGGVWYAANDEALPRGRLLVGRLDPGSGSLVLQVPNPHVLNGPTPAADAWGLRLSYSIRAQPSADGAQVSLEVSTAGALGLHSSLQLALDGTAMTVHRSPERRAPMSAPGCRTVLSAPDSSGGAGSSGASQALSSLRQYLGSLGSMRVQLESLCYRRVGLEFDREPAEGEPPGMALLRARQGLYCGSYGPHGQEVLRLAASTAAANAPPNCPISGPRLQALKLLGDPNVPALKFSFVADAASCRLGPYDPHLDDPFAPGGGAARPCLAFFEGATLVVDVEQRPVAARFRAVGQINQVPGLWQPQWVPATLLLYGSGPLERVVTVIFEDEGEPFRHAIDLQEWPFASADFVSPEPQA